MPVQQVHGVFFRSLGDGSRRWIAAMAAMALLFSAAAAYGQNGGRKTAKAASAEKDDEDFSPEDVRARKPRTTPATTK